MAGRHCAGCAVTNWAKLVLQESRRVHFCARVAAPSMQASTEEPHMCAVHLPGCCVLWHLLLCKLMSASGSYSCNCHAASSAGPQQQHQQQHQQQQRQQQHCQAGSTSSSCSRQTEKVGCCWFLLIFFLARMGSRVLPCSRWQTVGGTLSKGHLTAEPCDPHVVDSARASLLGDQLFPRVCVMLYCN
jgi:hypothetical protein